MGSSSDSDSDSDSSACLVYKKARVVKWSDDEASDEDAPITLPDREDSPRGDFTRGALDETSEDERRGVGVRVGRRRCVGRSE